MWKDYKTLFKPKPLIFFIINKSNLQLVNSACIGSFHKLDCLQDDRITKMSQVLNFKDFSIKWKELHN